mmetsp:Transcript_18903/g.45533  ORF Transcript_18903/g.45533 Transcript_18903/m.45533 type:complete len:320 (-) Transcript_18903:950-1909(-)
MAHGGADPKIRWGQCCAIYLLAGLDVLLALCTRREPNTKTLRPQDASGAHPHFRRVVGRDVKPAQQHGQRHHGLLLCKPLPNTVARPMRERNVGKRMSLALATAAIHSESLGVELGGLGPDGRIVVCGQHERRHHSALRNEHSINLDIFEGYTVDLRRSRPDAEGLLDDLMRVRQVLVRLGRRVGLAEHLLDFLADLMLYPVVLRLPDEEDGPGEEVGRGLVARYQKGESLVHDLLVLDALAGRLIHGLDHSGDDVTSVRRDQLAVRQLGPSEADERTDLLAQRFHGAKQTASGRQRQIVHGRSDEQFADVVRGVLSND